MIIFKNKKINNIFLGKAKVSKIYKGSNLIYYELPSNYQEVEYIESTGTQYLDLGKKSTVNTKFDFTYISNKTNGGAFQNLFGSQYGPIKNRIYMLLGSNERPQLNFPRSNTGTPLYPLKSGNFTQQTNSSESLYIKINQNDKAHIIYDVPNRSVTINQYECISTSTDTLTASDYNILVFNRNDSTTPTSNLATGRLYNFKWYESNKLVMNLIPCYRKSDNEIGLYDIVNNVFYANVGTGTFLKGGDVQ